MKIPVVIISFDRPAYFEKVLSSIVRQKNIDLNDFCFFLFQDGAVNPISGRVCAEAANIEESISLFQKYIPDGSLVVSDINLGIALNFERAEKFVFEELKSEYALFFEDDMELGPYYISTLLRMIDLAARRADIAYVSAFGRHNKSVARQMENVNELAYMQNNWGFALFRKHWLRMAPFLEQYMALVRGIDYRDRPDSKIVDLFHGWGVGCPGTSQDIAKSLSCYLAGSLKVSTYPAFATYIGEIGVHSTPEEFERSKFHQSHRLNVNAFSLDEIRDSALAPMKAAFARYCNLNCHPAKIRIGEPRHSTDVKATLDGLTVASTREKRRLSIADPFETGLGAAELKALAEKLAVARNYLEFGSGGTTRLALQFPELNVTSVESSRHRFAALSATPDMQQAMLSERLLLLHADMGDVTEQGAPWDFSQLRNWRAYYYDPWFRRDCKHDLVLIDGRFRRICALMAAVFAPDDALIAMHEHSEPSVFQSVGKYFDIIESVGSLTFAKKKRVIDPAEWSADYYRFEFNAM